MLDRRLRMFSAYCEGVRSLQSASSNQLQVVLCVTVGVRSFLCMCPQVRLGFLEGLTGVHQCFAEHYMHVQMIAWPCMHAAFTAQHEVLRQLWDQAGLVRTQRSPEQIMPDTPWLGRSCLWQAAIR